MPSPFPGMDPYLENPEIFPDLHDSLITYIRENLQANLPPPYYAAIGRRVWIEASRRAIEPDVHVLRAGAARQVPSPTSGATAVASRRAARPVFVKVLHDEFREPFLEIYAGSGDSKRLVTSIEVLSLSNKTPGEQARELFLRKQRELLASKVNLVEIDLLRKGHHSTAVPLEPALAACGPFDYHVSVHPFDDDDVETYYVYPMNLKEPLATIEVPLLPGDAAISLDLQVVFDRCYDAGPYAREVDYGESQIIPPLDANQAAWATAMLQNRRD